jgi:hypothetical protein
MGLASSLLVGEVAEPWQAGEVDDLDRVDSDVTVQRHVKIKPPTLPGAEQLGSKPSDAIVRASGLDQLEGAYQAIGSRRNGLTAVESAGREKAFWQRAGLNGVYWLLSRLRRETDTQVLRSSAVLLSELGERAINPVLLVLDSPWIEPQAHCLLTAVGWMNCTLNRSQVACLKKVVARGLRHPNVDLREAAVSASTLLPAQDAVTVLRDALQGEMDDLVLELLSEAIGERESE